MIQKKFKHFNVFGSSKRRRGDLDLMKASCVILRWWFLDLARQKQPCSRVTCGSGRWFVWNLKASWRFLHRSLFLTNAAVSCCSPQEGSSKVNMNQQEFSLSAGDSILVPEQTQWVDVIITCLCIGCIIGVLRVCWGHGEGHWIFLLFSRRWKMK